MVSRKRAREESEQQKTSAEPAPQEHGLLHELRNMWEFANLMEYIYLFGKPMKIDEDFGMEVRAGYTFFAPVLFYFILLLLTG